MRRGILERDAELSALAEAIGRLAGDAGCTGFRRVAETPFNIIYEVRP